MLSSLSLGIEQVGSRWTFELECVSTTDCGLSSESVLAPALLSARGRVPAGCVKGRLAVGWITVGAG